MAQPPKNSTPPQHAPHLSPTTAAAPPPAQQPMRANSKSRTIIRMLTTKFTPRSNPSTAHPRRGPALPTSPPNAFSAEARTAALRERGLLPPLPARDLSTQEMEQDRHIPIVSGRAQSPDGDEEAVSAADLIKREWEAKNSAASAPSTGRCSSDAGDAHDDAPPATSPTPTPGQNGTQPVDAEALNRERMRGFRFGGANTPPSPIQEGHTTDTAESPESTHPKEHDDDNHTPHPLPPPPRPPRAPSPSSSPPAPSAIPTPGASQYTSTAPLSPPPTDALPPLPVPPSSASFSSASALSRPLPSPPATPTARQIHPDLQAFTFPPPSPIASSAPALALNLGRASEESGASTLDHPPPGGMDAWAAALPAVPASRAPSVKSVRSTRSARSARAGAPLPMPSSPPPPTPASPTLAQAQAGGPLVPLLVSSPAISLTPPVQSHLADVGVEGGGGGGGASTSSEGRGEGVLHAANGDRARALPLQFSSPSVYHAPAGLSLASPSTAPAIDAAPPSPRVPKGKLGALTVQTRAAGAAPVLSEELAVVVEEPEREGLNGGAGAGGKRSPVGSVTPTPSTARGGAATPMPTSAAAPLGDAFASEDSAADPAQYVYAVRPPGAAAPLVASPMSSSHSHTSSSSSGAAAASASPGTRAARVPLPPTPTTPTILVSSPTPAPATRGRRTRAPTDPAAAGGAEKKRGGTFNPFKRSASTLVSSSSRGGDGGPTRRLSVAASLSHLKRSLTSASSAPAPAPRGNARTFNAAHLPPSPTLHGGGAHAAFGGGANGTGHGQAVRQAVAPMVYSEGRILAEASAIEDEESRRMTELAFLG